MSGGSTRERRRVIVTARGSAACASGCTEALERSAQLLLGRNVKYAGREGMLAAVAAARALGIPLPQEPGITTGAEGVALTLARLREHVLPERIGVVAGRADACSVEDDAPEPVRFLKAHHNSGVLVGMLAGARGPLSCHKASTEAGRHALATGLRWVEEDRADLVVALTADAQGASALVLEEEVRATARGAVPCGSVPELPHAAAFLGPCAERTRDPASPAPGAAEACVIGMGVVSQFGVGVERFWQAVASGVPAHHESGGLVAVPASVWREVDLLLPPEVPRSADATCLGAAAASVRAMRMVRLPKAVPARLACVVVCQDIPRMSHQPLAAARVGGLSVRELLQAALGREVASWRCVDAACASGAAALDEALGLLRQDLADAVLVVASDMSGTDYTREAYGKLGALAQADPGGACVARPFDRERSGMVVGEAAAALLLARPGYAPPLARILSVGMSSDAWHVTAPRPDASGMAAAMRDALVRAGVLPGQVDFVHAHGTATERNDLCESEAIARVLGTAVPCTSTKGTTGHALQAAALLETVICVEACRRSFIPPVANLRNQDPAVCLNLVRTPGLAVPVRLALNNCFGFGGHNASVLVARAAQTTP